MKARVLLCLAARQVCMCFGNFSSLLSNGGTIRHSYIPADRLTTVSVLLLLRPSSAKVVLPLEPCPAHMVQLRLSKLVIFPTTTSCIFHHTSGGVWITIIIGPYQWRPRVAIDTHLNIRILSSGQSGCSEPRWPSTYSLQPEGRT